MTHSSRLERLLNPGLIAIIRAPDPALIPPALEALISGGVHAIELTMTTPGALGALGEAKKRCGDRGLIGLGTVLDADTARQGIDAGTDFLVSPILRPEIAVVGREARCPVMLGAYTPTEAQLVHEAGADFVKIFPADGLGPAYIKALRAPLPHLRIVPTGGVDVNTAPAFLEAGCPALGIGSSLVSAALLRTRDWPELTRRAKALVEVVTATRQRLQSDGPAGKAAQK